jgi:hypothetical protein
MRGAGLFLGLWCAAVGCAPSRHRGADVAAAGVPVQATFAATAAAEDPARVEAEIERQAIERLQRGDVPRAVASDPYRGLIDCRTLWYADQTGAAADGYRDLIRAWPLELLPRVGYARLLLESQDGSGAADALAPVADRLDALPDGRWLAGVAWLHGGNPDRGVALLREELANGSWFRAAARELSDWFASIELHGDALAIIDAALRRAPDDYWLRLCRGRLEFDVARFDVARETAAALLRERPSEPRARLLEADAAQAQGERAVAIRDLAWLLGPDQRGDPWTDLRRDALEERLAALRNRAPDRPPPLTAEAMLALVRGADRTGERLGAYRALAADPRTNQRATQVAIRHLDPVLRVAAVRGFAPADAEALEDFLVQVVRDPDRRVRGAAYVRAGQDLDSPRATELLVAALDAEEDPYAFRCAHEGLERALGPLVRLSPGDAESVDGRERVREEWRLLCPE